MGVLPTQRGRCHRPTSYTKVPARAGWEQGGAHLLMKPRASGAEEREAVVLVAARGGYFMSSQGHRGDGQPWATGCGGLPPAFRLCCSFQRAGDAWPEGPPERPRCGDAGAAPLGPQRPQGTCFLLIPPFGFPF